MSFILQKFNKHKTNRPIFDEHYCWKCEIYHLLVKYRIFFWLYKEFEE